MTTTSVFDFETQVVGIAAGGQAELLPAEEDPPTPFAGLTVGLVTMTENAPHGGECHPDGDEVLILIAGRVRVVFENPALADVDVAPGQGLVVPAGEWHRVDIQAPSQIVYLTPGPNGDFRLP